jgi:hypothetical protein
VATGTSLSLAPHLPEPEPALQAHGHAASRPVHNEAPSMIGRGL